MVIKKQVVVLNRRGPFTDTIDLSFSFGIEDLKTSSQNAIVS